MPLIVRKGDTGTHGGQIITGSGNVNAEGKPVARKGDTYDCPAHGPNPIVQGSGTVNANGLPVVRHGDLSGCGAAMISGATHVYAA
jgi:uncharacterized Zn-binding protein involved in type VI secretion